MAPAFGLNLPEPVLTQPGLDAINPSVGPVEILAGGAIARGGSRAALSVLRKTWQNKKRRMQKERGSAHSENAYSIAVAGGKHSGFLKRYQDATDMELKRGINSLNKEIKEHVQKIENPEKTIPNFRNMDVRKQRNLIEKKWPSDIRRLEEQKEILRSIQDGKN